MSRPRRAPAKQKPTGLSVTMLKWLGWAEYNNTGRPFRWWEFKVAAPAVNALPGDNLQDRGPDMESRFLIRRKGDDVCEATPEQVRALLGGPTPEWTPPVRTDPELLKVQHDTVRAFGLLADVLSLLIPKPEPPRPKKAEPKHQGRGVYAENKKGRAGRFYAVNSKGHVVAEREVDPWHSTPAEEACLASELQDLLTKMDPQPEPIPDSEAVEALLANLNAPGPEEPRAPALLEGSAERRFYNSRWKLQQRRDREIRERGKDCSDCGEHFKPRTIKQLRCPGCIQARKRGDAR